MAHTNLSLRNAGLLSKIKPTTVTLVAPASGVAAGGTAITITGTNFRPGAQAVIGGVPCTSEVVVSKTSMTAVTGAHAIAAGLDCVVTNPLGGDGHGLAGTGVALYEYT